MIAPWKVMILFLLAYLIVGTMDYAAAQAYYLGLLETSMQAAHMDECERSFPGKGRPEITISRQDRTGEPWHHRTCIYGRP